MSLILSRKINEEIHIDCHNGMEPIIIRVNRLTNKKATLAVKAPDEYEIIRPDRKPIAKVAS